MVFTVSHTSHRQTKVITDYGTQLLDSIGTALGVVAPHQVVLSAKDGKNRAWLYQSGAVLDETLLTDGSLKLTVQADDKLLGQMRQRQVHVETTS